MKSNRSIAVKFLKDNENVKSYELTFSRAATWSALPLAEEYGKKNQTKMSALGLNIGWQGLLVEKEFESLNKYIEDKGYFKEKSIKLSYKSIYLCIIPRIRPNKYLDMNNLEMYLFLIFNFLNDLTICRNDVTNISFSADTYSKLINIGFEMNEEIFKKLFIKIYSITRRYCNKRSVENEFLAKFLKTFIKASTEGKITSDRTEEEFDKIFSSLESLTLREREAIDENLKKNRSK